MRKLIVELPDEVHGELKRKAAITNKTLKDIISGLIQAYLAESGKPESKPGKTGLCGRWDDDRTPEEIVKDIKTHRRWFARQKGKDA